MKTQLIKLKKSDGYIAIETVIIASLAIAAGFISLTTVLGDLGIRQSVLMPSFLLHLILLSKLTKSIILTRCNPEFYNFSQKKNNRKQFLLFFLFGLFNQFSLRSWQFFCFIR